MFVSILLAHQTEIATTFCLGDKIASHPGVLTQSKKNTQNLEINQIFGVVVQEKESNYGVLS